MAFKPRVIVVRDQYLKVTRILLILFDVSLAISSTHIVYMNLNEHLK